MAVSIIQIKICIILLKAFGNLKSCKPNEKMLLPSLLYEPQRNCMPSNVENYWTRNLT